MSKLSHTFKTTLAIASFPLVAIAQDQSPQNSKPAENQGKDFQSLEPSVVTATRTAKQIGDTPYTASILDRIQLDDRFVRTIPDALDSTPGVLVQKTGYGQGSPFIRGYTGRNNVLLLDGVRLNNSTWREGPVQYWNTFDQEAVSSFELIKGQGSVLYGSDAIGGTANIISRSSGFRDETGFFTHGRSKYRFDTNSQSHVGRLEASLGEGGKYGLTLGLTKKDFGDIKDSAVGRMNNTGYGEEAFDLKFEYALSADSTLTFAHQYLNQDDAQRWHRTQFNPGWIHGNHVIPDQTATGARSEIFDQERSLTYLKIDGTAQDRWFDNYATTFSYQKTQDSSTRDRTNVGNSLDVGNIDLQTFGFDLQLESEIGPGKFVYGLDYYRDEIDTFATKNGEPNPAARPVADDSNYDLLGFFGQYEWEPIEKFEVTTGARYSYASAAWGKNFNSTLKQDFSGDNSWDDLSLSLRGNYKLNQVWSIYGGASQAFRAPNFSDLTGNTVSRDGILDSGSINVNPETYINYELGTRYQKETISVGVAAYYSDRTDQIASIPISNVEKAAETRTNTGEGYVYGIEMDATWNFAQDWQARIFSAWQDGKVSKPNFLDGPFSSDTAARMHPFMGGASLRWTHPGQKFWVEGRLKAAATADNLSKSDAGDTTRIPAVFGTPSYAIASIYTGYNVNDNLELTLGLENLADDDYRYHGSGQNEPGLNALFGATVTF
jgi:hemoglobin/transferrin/lactoferrin receptor protein